MGTRVLLAAESTTLQELLPQDFISREAQVTWVSDGISARQFINDMDPDLLIAEISLGGVSGFELCECVRESSRHRNMPVILVDTEFEALNQAQACKTGVDIYLAKPFDQEKIAETVSKLMQRDRTDRANPAPASILFNEGLASDSAHELRAEVPEAAPSRAGSDVSIAEPGDSAKDRKPPEIRPTVPPQPNLLRGDKRFPALLWLTLIGLIVGSLALLAPRSTPRVETPKREHGIVSASDEQPKTGSAEEAQSGSSSSGVENSDARASDLPVAVENPGTEKSVPLPPLALNSLATRTEGPETSSNSASATDRAAESADASSKPSAETAEPFTHSMTATPKARPAGRAGARAHFRRSGRDMREAGKNIGSGLKHFGIASKKSAVWSGKRAGSGVKGFGKAVKGLFN